MSSLGAEHGRVLKGERTPKGLEGSTTDYSSSPELIGCLLGGDHSCLGSHVRTQLPMSARALGLFQLAHRLTSLLQS